MKGLLHTPVFQT